MYELKYVQEWLWKQNYMEAQTLPAMHIDYQCWDIRVWNCMEELLRLGAVASTLLIKCVWMLLWIVSVSYKHPSLLLWFTWMSLKGSCVKGFLTVFGNGGNHQKWGLEGGSSHQGGVLEGDTENQLLMNNSGDREKERISRQKVVKLQSLSPEQLYLELTLKTSVGKR